VPGQDGEGYVELPYTLVQDSTLFVMLQKQSNEIWKRKLEWIAKNGGMALLIVHPDYVSFKGKQAPGEYPLKHYTEFLDWVKQTYDGKYWQKLPREIAACCHPSSPHNATPTWSAGAAAACA
jgi:hypothetical protein